MKRFLGALLLILAGAAAAEQGNANAAGSGDISYWTTAYAGDDLTAGKYDCQAPAIPAVSTTNASIAATNKAVIAWEACYNSLVDAMSDAKPLDKRIPAEVRAKMTPADLERARAHLDEVYGKVVDRVQASAAAITAQRDAWRSATEKYVVQQNQEIAARNAAAKAEIDVEQRLREDAQGRGMREYRPPAPRAAGGGR
jgi:hypothetical protein